MKKQPGKIFCIIMSAFLLLTACGKQQGSDERISQESKLPSEEISGTDASMPDASSVPDSADASIPDDSATSNPATQTDKTNNDSSDAGILVANIRGESSFLSGRVINFSKENPEYGIQYLDAYEGAEPERILMEVANGKGPDILYVYREDAESLRESGALGEIGLFISEENRNVLLPGAIQMGTYGDKLFGIPLSVFVRSLLTSREYWQEDSWTTEDILSVLEGRPEIEGLFVDIAGADEYYYNMLFLLGINIKNSPFIQDGNSNFDCEEFRSLLTTVKDMTHKGINNSTPMDRLLPLTEGNYLGVECFIYDMSKLCSIYETMGDNANLVGFPCDMGTRHYLMDSGMLVVNQNAVEKAGIGELINDLLSLESQKYVGGSISVRTDIPESQLVYNEYGKNYIWMSPSHEGFQLPAKEDGSSYQKELEAYVELIKSAVPRAVGSDEIFGIVMEEANGYFESDKSLDEVIDIIQTRVQIYLDERK